MPKVSVLMSVFNGAPYLREAIASILNQTLGDYEFLIINDASTDGTQDILKQYNDPRIKIVLNTENLGVARSLNIGLQMASGEYIARMDADDISVPHRFATQVQFMDANPEVGICGAFMSKSGSQKLFVYPVSEDQIRVALLFRTPFGHPTIMLRKNAMCGMLYNEEIGPSQDYELWTRLLRKTKPANIPEVLVLYREHSRQISKSKVGCQQENAISISLGQMCAHDPGCNYGELKIFLEAIYRKGQVTSDSLAKVVQCCERLCGHNSETGKYSENVFNAEVARHLWNICLFNTCLGLICVKSFYLSSMSEYYSPSVFDIARLVAKSLLRYQRE